MPWPRGLAELLEFPLSATVLHQLPRVTDAEQFERGLAALANGLTTELRHDG